MKRRAVILTAVLAAALIGTGGVVASALQDVPQDAPRPDPVGDLNRQNTPVETAPAATPAPSSPVAVATPGGAEAVAAAEEAATDGEEEAKTEAEPARTVTEPETPAKRQRRRIAIVQAIDKVTAESYRFEVVVGGRPVRFNQALIFTARACEVSGSDERAPEAAAYLEVSVQPRGTAQPTEARQIFRGWMFASAPAVSGLQHPVYDAWVVGCKA
ncbi:MAG: DUF2155 domain-containing protein [Pseudomonadota bacterium]